jgi:hypothetical protein
MFLPSFAKLILCLAAVLCFAADGLAQTATAPQTLSTGVPVGPYASSQGALRYFRLAIPAGASSASFVISGTSGDCDLYVKRGAVPTTSVWDYRPYLSSSNETVNVTAPAAGDWYVMLRAYTAYSGVTLTAKYQVTTQPTPVAAAPTFTPAPGSYSGQVYVSLATTTPGAVIRFTTDGSTPSTSSEVYNAPLMVTSSLTVKAITTATGYTTSTVSSGAYTISNAIRTLTKDLPVPNLTGARASQALFKFSVPAGQTSLNINITGASTATGDCDLYVKRGAVPTTSVWDYRPYMSRSNETVQVSNPAAGDWYIMLYGYTAFTGVTLTGSYSGSVVTGKPDLIFHAASMSPRITTETFSATDCAVVEQAVPEGTHKLLRFSTETRNIGTADLVLGNPANNSSFVWGSCHGHYHFNSFAAYRLLNTAGQVVRTGNKVGFCLMDISRHNTAANPSPRYNCSNQGIQAGWADIYSSNLTGQWIVITGLAAGSYILEVEVDPMGYIDEADETNNITRVNVTIP